MKLIHSALLLLLLQTVFGQNKRELLYADLEDPGNAAFYRRHNYFVQLVMEAITQNRIKPYSVSYNNDVIIQELEVQQWKMRLKHPFSETYSVFPSDLKVIGLDIATFDSVQEIQYIHFYYEYQSWDDGYEDPDSPGNRVEPGQLKYYFSVSGPAFLQYIRQYYPHLLYTSNAWNIWFRGNIFNTKNLYFIDSNAGMDWIEAAKKRKQQIFTDSAGAPVSIDSYKRSEQEVYPFNALIHEKKSNLEYILSGIDLVESMSLDYLYSKRFGMTWENFLTLANDSVNVSYPPIQTWEEAIATLQFLIQRDRPTKSLPPLKQRIEPIDLTSIQEIKKRNLEQYQIDAFYLHHPKNRAFYQKEKELSTLILEYVFEKKIKAYANDSTSRILSFEEIKINNQRILDVPQYDHSLAYKTGDLVRFDDTLFRAKVPITKKKALCSPLPNNEEYQRCTIHFKNEKGIESSVSSISKKKGESFHFTNIPERHKWQPYNPERYSGKELNVLEIKSLVQFDTLGLNKRYTPNCITLYIPADINPKEIQFTVFTVKWIDLKPLLLSDERAESILGNRKTNMATLIEDRNHYVEFIHSTYPEFERK